MAEVNSVPATAPWPVPRYDIPAGPEPYEPYEPPSLSAPDTRTYLVRDDRSPARMFFDREIAGRWDYLKENRVLNPFHEQWIGSEAGGAIGRAVLGDLGESAGRFLAEQAILGPVAAGVTRVPLAFARPSVAAVVSPKAKYLTATGRRTRVLPTPEMVYATMRRDVELGLASTRSDLAGLVNGLPGTSSEGLGFLRRHFTNPGKLAAAEANAARNAKVAIDLLENDKTRRALVSARIRRDASDPVMEMYDKAVRRATEAGEKVDQLLAEQSKATLSMKGVAAETRRAGEEALKELGYGKGPVSRLADKVGSAVKNHPISTGTTVLGLGIAGGTIWRHSEANDSRARGTEAARQMKEEQGRSYVTHTNDTAVARAMSDRNALTAALVNLHDTIARNAGVDRDRAQRDAANLLLGFIDRVRSDDPDSAYRGLIDDRFNAFRSVPGLNPYGDSGGVADREAFERAFPAEELQLLGEGYFTGLPELQSEFMKLLEERREGR